MKINLSVRERLEALIEYVEAHGSGALRGQDELEIFSYSQAETYIRYYDGLKREAQEQSIESQLIDIDDSLFGWGWLANHDPQVRPVGPSEDFARALTSRNTAELTLAVKRAQPAEIISIKRPYICPTFAMSLIHGTMVPTPVPGKTPDQVRNRIKRLITQTHHLGIKENLYNLRTFTRQGQTWVGLGNATFKVGPIT